MNTVLDDPKFKVELLDGYDALNDLLRLLDDGGSLQRWNAGDGYEEFEGEDEMKQRLQGLRNSLRGLIVGQRIER